MLKKILCLILSLLIALLSIGIASADENDPEYWVKCSLKYGTAAVSSYDVSCREGFLLATVEDGRVKVLDDLSDHTSLHVYVESGKIKVSTPDGTVLTDSLSGNMLISCNEAEDGRFLQLSLFPDWKYRDGITGTVNANGNMNVINWVTLEHYTWGVINSEVGSNYPAEAQKAQAVAIRSFAVAGIDTHSSYGFHVCDTTHCQAYYGCRKESLAGIDACKATEGECISYNGNIVKAYYYDRSSGWTMNTEDVWGNHIGYCRAVKDEFTSGYEWTGSISFEDLKAKMLAKNEPCGDILSVEVVRRCDNGAVYQLLLKTTDQNCTITRENLRTYFGNSIVKSQFFSIGSEADPEIIKGGSGGLKLIGADTVYDAPQTINVLAADGSLTQIALSDLVISDGKNTYEVSESSETEYGWTDEVVTGGMLYFHGLGNAHGIGMPQTSIYNMAKAGYGYEDILDYYYTDIEIVNVNE